MPMTCSVGPTKKAGQQGEQEILQVLDSAQERITLVSFDKEPPQ
jgi:hypothetical protein